MAEELLPPTVPDSDEIDFSKEEMVRQDAATSRVHGINPARWERAIEEVNFQDLVEELTGHRSNDKISCPFHGTDSTPSFGFWPHKNNGFCFGCPPGEQYYDNILFAAKWFSFSRVKALMWLEKTYKLPPMEDVLLEDEFEEEEEVLVELADLVEPYIRQARREVQQHQDPELALGYIQRYFEAEHDNDPVLLARVLDPSTLLRIQQKKAFK